MHSDSRQINSVAQRLRTGAMPRSVHRAFTLIETIATLTILGAIGSVASFTILNAIDSYLQAAARAQIHSELSIAMDQIDRELRSIPLKTDTASAPNITSVNANSINWTAGSTNYSLTCAGGVVRMTSGGNSPILLQNVTAFTVQAFDQENVLLAGNLNSTACEAIRRVQVQITVQRSGVSETLRTKVFLRSTMTGSLS